MYQEEGIENVNFNNLFPKMLKLTIKRKIELTVIRYKNNYFLNKSASDIATVPDEIRPLKPITQEIYKKCIKYDMRAKEKKLAWVFDNMDKDYAKSFKELYAEDKFPSVREATTLACSIYAESNFNYNKAKAVVSSFNGSKVVKRKTAEETQSISEVFRERLKNKEKKILEIVKLGKNKFQKEVDSRNKNGHFGYELIGSATGERQRIMSMTISLINELLSEDE
jgi:hypothetical protein